MYVDSKTAENNAVLQTAYAVCAAARTAPKACGIDHFESCVLTGAEKDALTAEMRRLGEQKAFFKRDADNVDGCAAVVLLGMRQSVRGLGECCRLCHFENCAASKKAGAGCAFDYIDLGIALGSAVSLAADMRLDNRIMFSIGQAAASLGLLGEDVELIMGVPLCVKGKSPFFDRAEQGCGK